MRVMREFKLFIFAIVLPTLFIAVGGAWLVSETWRRLWEDERKDLTIQAGLVADSIMRRVREEDRAKRANNVPLEDPLFGGRPPLPNRHPPRPAHAREFRWRISAERLQEICGDYRKSLLTPAVIAFEIRDNWGVRIYATGDYPSRPVTTGSCDLGPPLGDGILTAARIDGGAAVRKRAALLVSVGGCLVLLLVVTGVSAGLLLLQEVRRQRDDARRKTDFIDNISHELKTPLAGIRLNAELLAENRIPDEKRRRGALESILIEADRLGRMVSELLDFGRLEKGTFRYAIETFDLAAFASNASEIQSVAAISNGRARVSITGPGVTVSADKNAIRQIGVNLVTNAVKYTDGEIDIEVEGAEIRYMDRGQGVPPGCEERIFERFYRVDDLLTRKGGGSGLGLAIARARARGMGGDLTYAHRLGGGSVFTLSLACADSGNGETAK